MRAQTQSESKKNHAVLTVWLPKALDRALEHEATNRDVSKRRVVEEALRQYLGMQEEAA